MFPLPPITVEPKKLQMVNHNAKYSTSCNLYFLSSRHALQFPRQMTRPLKIRTNMNVTAFMPTEPFLSVAISMRLGIFLIKTIKAKVLENCDRYTGTCYDHIDAFPGWIVNNGPTLGTGLVKYLVRQNITFAPFVTETTLHTQFAQTSSAKMVTAAMHFHQQLHDPRWNDPREYLMALLMLLLMSPTLLL